MKKITFANINNEITTNDSYIAYLKNINSEDELFNALNSQLQFPEYFGYNWNALYDCLRDFHWIKQKKIMIIHKDVPCLDDKVMKLYIEVLLESMNSWKEDENHSLEVVFPLSAKSILTKYFNI